MSDETVGTSAIRNYLLGDLTESEAEEIERWYFAAPQSSQRVDEIWAVFGVIAEEYLSGALSEIESRRFEQKLRSTPALREMFENEKALFDYAARAAAGTSRQAETDDSIAGVRWRGRPPAAFFKPTQLMAAGVTTLIALGALITWFAVRTREGAPPVSRAQLQKGPQQTTLKDQKSPEGIAQPSADPQRPPQSGRDANDKISKAPPDQRKSAIGINPGIAATFLLLAAGVREGQSDPILEIPAQAETVQLELELPDDDCDAFSAVLRAESDEALQRWEKLRARRDHSTLRVTPLRARADSLKSASYVIRLDCLTRHKNPVPAKEYRFKVEKK